MAAFRLDRVGLLEAFHALGTLAWADGKTVLFAMKCWAMRLGGGRENGDIDDICGLAREIGLTGAAVALALVASFYPGSQLQPKVQFGIEEIFSDMTEARPDR